MRTFLIAAGLILIGIGVMAMLMFIILPAALPSFDTLPPLKTVLQAVSCKPGDTLVDSRTDYNPSPGRTDTVVSITCVDPQGQPDGGGYDAILYGGVGFVVPFLLGLFITNAGFAMKKPTTTAVSTVNEPGSAQAMSAFLSQRADRNFSVDRGELPLNERLRQLKAALDEGLNNPTEYQAKRAELLKEL